MKFKIESGKREESAAAAAGTEIKFKINWRESRRGVRGAETDGVGSADRGPGAVGGGRGRDNKKMKSLSQAANLNGEWSGFEFNECLCRSPGARTIYLVIMRMAPGCPIPENNEARARPKFPALFLHCSAFGNRKTLASLDVSSSRGPRPPPTRSPYVKHKCFPHINIIFLHV